MIRRSVPFVLPAMAATLLVVMIGGLPTSSVADAAAGAPAARPGRDVEVLAPRLEGGTLVAETEPMHLVVDSAVRAPDDPPLAVVGPPGAEVWSTDAAGGDGLRLVWDTTALPSGALRGDVLRWTLQAIDGPGDLTVLTPRTLHRAPVVHLSSHDTAAKSADLPVGARSNVVWVFDTPGRYEVVLRAEADVAGTGVQHVDTTFLVAVAGGRRDEGPSQGEPAPSEARTFAAEEPVRPGPQPASAGDPLIVAAADEQGSGRKVIGDGHVDIGPQLVDGAWRAQLRDDTGPSPVWRHLTDVVLQANAASATTVPSDPAFGFLGAPGTQFWLLPQTQKSGVLWPGWNTQAEAVKAVVPGSVTWSIHRISGPGSAFVFLSGSFGAPQVLFDSTEPFPQALQIPPNTHAHGNWAFTREGIYRFDLEFAGVDTSGQRLSHRTTLAFAVGSADPNAGFGTDGSTGAGAGASSGAAGTGSGSGATPGSGSSLASTGADVAVLFGVAVALLATGATLIATSHRRDARHPSRW